jgi:hypothetical protein
MTIVYDLQHPSGPAEIKLDETSAREMLARGEPGRYVRELPAGTKLGPKSGPDRIVIS